MLISSRKSERISLETEKNQIENAIQIWGDDLKELKEALIKELKAIKLTGMRESLFEKG